MEPGAKRAVPAKAPDAAPGADEDVLGQILRVALPDVITRASVITADLVPADQLVERLTAAARCGLDERAVRIHFG